jgi:uncharacterized protein
MRQAIIDTNFIITCLKQKIDFFEELELIGIQIIIPNQVIDELKKNKSNLALELLKKEKLFFKKVNLGKGHVDKRIIDYAQENPDVLIATLDRGIKSRIKNKKIVIRGKKKLEII